jgi:hypothetical protein
MGILSGARRACTTAAALLVVSAMGVSRPSSAAPTPAEVEAVFLFNFSQFVDWPPQTFADPNAPIVIGVLGNDPFGVSLDDVVRGEVVKGHPLVVHRSHRVEDLVDCHILFISRSERTRLGSILKALQGRNILTVSDVEGFARAGGVICFVLTENKIRLRVNLEAAKAAGLTLSSKLLRPAQIVSPGES